MNDRIIRNPVSMMLFIAVFPAISPLAIDICLPAFSAITERFDAPRSPASLTITCFLAGFALTQLVVGPLSDRFGRRPLLIISATIFAIASCACVFAPTFNALLELRVLLGIGRGGCMVIAFAIVRDLFEGRSGRLSLAYINSFMWLAPLFAPTLGSVALLRWGWNGPFIILAVAGTGLVLAATFLFSETLLHQSRKGLNLRSVASNY